MIRPPPRPSLAAAPCRGAAIFVLLAWVFLTQTLLIVHRIDHTTARESVTCTLCVAADHLATAVPDTLHAIDGPEAMPVASTVTGARGTPTLVSYHSRAPPDRPRA